MPALAWGSIRGVLSTRGRVVQGDVLPDIACWYGVNQRADHTAVQPVWMSIR